MEEFGYSHIQKRKLVTRIGKLKNKDDVYKVYEIIKTHENRSSKEIGKNVCLFFHDLQTQTYQEIEKFLNVRKKSRKGSKTQSESESEYVIYSYDDLSDSKFGYSNRERNLIKKRRYEQKINGPEKDIVYCKFDEKDQEEDSDVGPVVVKPKSKK